MVPDSCNFEQPAADPVAELLQRLLKKFKPFREFRPLRIGIDWEIHQALPTVPRKRIRRAIQRHVSSLKYQLALARGGARYGLDGRENGIVPETHRAHAKNVLGRLRKRAPRPKPPTVLHRSVLHHADPAGKKKRRKAVAVQSIGVVVARRVTP